MPNLGYRPTSCAGSTRTSGRSRSAGVPGTSPWVAFGRGVHAASGLGVVAGEPAPSLLAYPDPLAGLLAFGAVLGALAGAAARTIEVSLAGAMAPLLPTAGRPLGDARATLSSQLAPPGPVLLRDREPAAVIVDPVS